MASGLEELVLAPFLLIDLILGLQETLCLQEPMDYFPLLDRLKSVDMPNGSSPIVDSTIAVTFNLWIIDAAIL